jgi:hypothetical protein
MPWHVWETEKQAAAHKDAKGLSRCSLVMGSASVVGTDRRERCEQWCEWSLLKCVNGWKHIQDVLSTFSDTCVVYGHRLGVKQNGGDQRIT